MAVGDYSYQTNVGEHIHIDWKMPMTTTHPVPQYAPQDVAFRDKEEYPVCDITKQRDIEAADMAKAHCLWIVTIGDGTRYSWASREKALSFVENIGNFEASELCRITGPDGYTMGAVDESYLATRAVATNEIERLEERIVELACRKDDAVRNANYDEACVMRDELDTLKAKRLSLMESSVKLTCPPPFVKALVVDDKAGFWKSEDIEHLDGCAEADVVVTKEGRVLKNTHGHTPFGEFVPTNSLHGSLREMLSCLSGDLNHDNVAKAKEILKNLLN